VLQVHSSLPDALTAAVDAALGGVGHVAHGDADSMRAAEAAAADADAVALLGPFRSREVAEVVEATAPAGLPLLAPAATWAGVTRDDEPGCDDDPARHRGTVLRMLARDTEVAARLAADVRAAGQRALVVAGEHEYGVQLDGQLRLVGLPRADDAATADLVVLCGLADGPRSGARARPVCPWSPSTAFRAAHRCPTCGSRCRSRPATTTPAPLRRAGRLRSWPRRCVAARATGRRC
jgi:hypothetical protein